MHGELIIRPLDSYLISEASENKELAFELLRFITTPEANEDNLVTWVPVNRGMLSSSLPPIIVQSIDFARANDEIEGDTDDIANNLVATLERYNDTPLAGINFADNERLRNVISEVLTNFQGGTLSAEQTASELQNKISLFLME